MAAGLSCLAYARSNRARFVAELGEFVRFASVSAQPEHAHDVRNCSSWLAAHLRQVGFERAQVVWTRGCLIVIRDWLRVPGRPTVLVYGYYDVQPVGSIGEWAVAAIRARRAR
jgi:acetylornithine deacetylase/succinyl-diaminopimelate desuccinylase-like protein